LRTRGRDGDHAAYTFGISAPETWAAETPAATAAEKGTEK
jgi:hypothetical protein